MTLQSIPAEIDTRPGTPLPLGEVCLLLGLLDENQHRQALQEYAAARLAFGEYCVREGLLTSADLIEALAVQRYLPHVRLSGARLTPGLEALLPANTARAYQSIPLWQAGEQLYLATLIPQDVQRRKQLAASLGRPVRWAICTPQDWEAAFNRRYLARQGNGRPARIPSRTPIRLGELLLAMGLLSPAQLAEALQGSPQRGRRLGERLVNLGYLDDLDLAEALSLQSGIPHIRLAKLPRLSPALLRRLGERWIQQHNALPLLSRDGQTWLLLSDPADTAALEEAETRLGEKVIPLLAPYRRLSDLIRQHTEPALRAQDPQPVRVLRGLIQRGQLSKPQAKSIYHRYVTQDIPFDVALEQVVSRPIGEMLKSIAADLNLPRADIRLRVQTVERRDALGKKITRKQLNDPVDPQAARTISSEMAHRLGALPIKQTPQGMVTAFADPLLARSKATLERHLGCAVIPVLVPRQQLEAAIRRQLGRPHLGTLLLQRALLTRHQLNEALDLAHRTGVRLGKALIQRGLIESDRLARLLAEQFHIPFRDLRREKIDPQVAHRIHPEVARREGILPLRLEGDRLVIAVVDPLDVAPLRRAAQRAGQTIQPILVSETVFDQTLEKVFRQNYRLRSAYELLQRFPQDSAARVLSRGQKIALGLFLALSLLWLLLDYRSFLIFWNAVFSGYYLLLFANLIYQVLNRTMEVPVSAAEIASLNERDLPLYTILVPVYHEAEVLPDLMEAIANLDYPTTKLEVLVLMEEDDLDTRAVFESMRLPPHFRGLIVPAGQPKTKPKACNYGLLNSRGEFVVIYDAEDLPDPDQLKRAVVAFNKSDPRLVCLQAKLNFYNSHQNLLTSWFTLEYTLWFDLFLPSLFAADVPMPLGGTSNHFRRQALLEVGAWDPHNVTEDADLGLRLYKRGYRSGFIDSTTYEEANSEVYNWIRQRSRWMKGYIQTWLVHMRNPVRLWREVGWKAFFSFQIVYAGAFFAALINPYYWLLTTFWYLFHLDAIHTIFPGAIYYMAAISLYVGNFGFTYVNAIASFRRRRFDLVAFAMLSPLYYGLISIAAWKGLLQLLHKPHFWEKTVHGLFRPEEVARAGKD